MEGPNSLSSRDRDPAFCPFVDPLFCSGQIRSCCGSRATAGDQQMDSQSRRNDVGTADLTDTLENTEYLRYGWAVQNLD